MKYGIVYAYWSKDWEGDYISTIKRAAKCGFDVLEIFTPGLLEVSGEKLKELRKAAQEYNIEFTFLVGLSKQYNIASPEGTIRREGISYVKKLLDVVHKLGGKCFSGINYCAWSDFEGYDRKQEYIQNSICSLKEIGRIAQDYDISYNLEITNRFENFLLNTAREARAFVDEVDNPNVNILLDVFHMNIEEDSFYDAIVTAGEKLGHFHVGQNNRRNPHPGDMVAWKLVADGLKKIGYDKRITLEPLVETGGTVSRDSNIWRDMTNGAEEVMMDQNVMEGLKFIRSLMEK